VLEAIGLDLPCVVRHTPSLPRQFSGLGSADASGVAQALIDLRSPLRRTDSVLAGRRLAEELTTDRLRPVLNALYRDAKAVG
jgi:hypothetical protein